MMHAIMIEKIIKIGTDQIAEIREFTLLDKIEVDQGMNKMIGEKILEALQEYTNILEDRIEEENIEVIIGMKIIAEKRVGVGLEEKSFSRNINNRRNDRRASNSRSRSGLRVSTNRDRISCYKCREYDHFTKGCPTSTEERELEQIQQMFHLDEGKTSLKTLATDMYDSLNKINSLENITLVQEHLNL